jgi:hypothetical protein
MIYIGALHMFSLPFGLISCIAVATRLLNLKTTSRSLAYGLVGSVGGYALAPPIGALVGLVPSVMIEPQYFIHPFYGCIAPTALGLACVTSFSGVVVGFVAGSYIGFRSRIHA